MEQVEQKENTKQELACTNGIKDTIKSMYGNTFEFLEEEVENSTFSSNKKLFRNNFLKFLSIITSKKYDALEKLKRIMKIAVTTAIKSCLEQN